MKKLMFSLCALCLVGAASAQVALTPVNGKAQKFANAPVSVTSESENLDVQSARKVDEKHVEVESAYEWNHSNYSLTWFPNARQDDLDKRGFCNEDQIRWTYGTGGLPTWTGTGELGYRFNAGPRSYYISENMYPNYGVPFAAAADIVRVPSPSMREEDADGKQYYRPMPLYFKIYNSSKVGAQKLRASITSNGPTDQLVNVVYPTDPEKYTALSDTVWIKADCILSNKDNQLHPYDTLVKSEFKDVDASQRLGDNFCLSMVFPIDWDEEGDSIIDPKWNASALVMSENGQPLISNTLHGVYMVVDFQKDDMWRDENDKRLGERPNGIVADSLTQPNARYAIVPFDSYYMKFRDGSISNSPDEIWMILYYTEWSALQSANKADRYVQLSPIPATDYVNFRSYTDMSRIEIYSLGGQLVKAVNVSGDTYRLDLTGMNSGMYVARIYSEKGISSKKFIVR